ncbi:MAG: hypothetical protein H0U62_14880 [Actinobacteria bacterium]|nr:hypothetical protein [Actinomycetota bacterium]
MDELADAPPGRSDPKACLRCGDDGLIRRGSVDPVTDQLDEEGVATRALDGQLERSLVDAPSGPMDRPFQGLGDVIVVNRPEVVLIRSTKERQNPVAQQIVNLSGQSCNGLPPHAP